MWNVLRNKVPTWENLQKRNFVGLGWCSLCKTEEETSTHLFLNCIYILKVWLEISKFLNVQSLWEGRNLEDSWLLWWNNMSYKHLKALPLLVIWGGWLAQKFIIFKGVILPPEISAENSVAHMPPSSSSLPCTSSRRTQELVLDRTSPWGFSDGASQQQTNCEGGGLLHLSSTHFFVPTSGLGTGTNNMSYKLLIGFALKKGFRRLKVYGDSLNVINWIKGTYRCLNIRLSRLVEDIKCLQTNFDFIDCQHVYREKNKEVDKRSKEGIGLGVGQWKIVEHHNEQTKKYWHNPILEQTSSF